MSSIILSKMSQLEALCKDFKASIKTPRMSLPKPPSPPKAKGVSPNSKKDPVKVAEQIQSPEIKPMAMDAAKQAKESMKVSKLGQWKIV
jgi:hypothetical protein